ncbi:Bis(5'-adenosyl)-triphosphatase [Cordyceps fumosorosea ARSEF 2679]|uniref:Bis(5'-adenosyl)-triphosphatase n=1 Tax=Cordyceps fumosorosea (strain ARSEF 2679) TaxID=1081104 RepID=A0A167UAP5_CORFA|nr:Bis(5'-adenosyl)-triphosphatase [Cordyceps fumosorosea ARSEF 2679]OAA61390.1 Bis(5'-adenosyl)-triphosphatase [Cordyceps fumosorosea ARSEF 2679]
MLRSCEGEEIKFGTHVVTKQAFYRSEHSYAIVNLKPLAPGHVLVCPLTPYERLGDPAPVELADLWSTVTMVQKILGRIYFKPEDGRGSFTVAVQDGPEAGQTVPHLHVHVIPRVAGDMGENEAANDEIYTKLASEEGNIGGALWDLERRPQPGGGMPRVEDASRVAREPEDMHAEAEKYREHFMKLYGSWCDSRLV